MLIGTPSRTSEKRLCLFIRNESFRLVLTGLLKEWRFILHEDPSAANLLLAEDCFSVPEDGPPVLWLTPSPREGQDRLNLPLSLEKLWAELESRFHTPPRSRIRINLELPAMLEARSEKHEIRIVSLSDLGGRFEFHRELVPGEELALSLSIDGRPLRLSGRVIYVLPHGDIEGSGKAQIGVIFDYPDKSMRKVLYDAILQICFERVRKGMAGNVFREGLSCFDVPQTIHI